MKPAKPRLPEFDIARGVAMLAIIFCHTCMLDYVTDGSQMAIEFCFTFNVALFFIVSGYFTKGTKVTKASLKKDAVSLLLPYAAASASLIVLATVFYLIVARVLWIALLSGASRRCTALVHILPVCRLGSAPLEPFGFF